MQGCDFWITPFSNHLEATPINNFPNLANPCGKTNTAREFSQHCFKHQGRNLRITPKLKERPPCGNRSEIFHNI